MATTPSPYEPVTADDVLSVQFTHIRKGGYDTQEVDGFLDRVAATLDRDRPLLPDGSMTSDDVRGAEFTQVKRGGYDTKEVDDFLDRVVAVLANSSGPPAAVDVVQDSAYEPPEVAAEPEPVEIPGQPELEPEQATQPTAAPLAGAATLTTPRLHDPEGAAQMLLAAAQQAADSLTAKATAFSEQTRGDADEYASATRTEADEHAAQVTSTAEAQAASIREVAADEARRVAEEARVELVGEIEHLEARHAELSGANNELELSVAGHRSELLATVDSLRARIADNLPDSDLSEDAAAVVAGAVPDVSGEVAAAFADVEDPQADRSGGVAEADESSGGEQVDAAADVAPPDAGEVLETQEPEAEPEAEDATADASRSVFDLADDAPADESSAAWLEAELDMDTPVDATPSGGLFDIEADPGWEDGDVPPEGQPGEASGDSFFDELREADAQVDTLGPLDDDTDAALAAFFEGDEEGEASGRWRDRFGPSKG